MGDRHTGVFFALIAVQQQPRPQRAHVHRCRRHVRTGDVRDVLFTADVSRQTFAAKPVTDLRRALLPDRQPQVDNLVPIILIEFHWRRRRVVIRNIEGRAIRKYASRRTDGELTNAQHVLVDREFITTPGTGTKPAAPPFDVLLEVADMLLKMLRP